MEGQGHTDGRTRGEESIEVVTQHDWEGNDCLAVTIAQATAEAWTGDPDDAMSLPPVGTVVDADALEQLFAPTRARHRTATDGGQPDRTEATEPARVRFTYVGYDVTISEGGVVVVEEPSSTADV